LTFQISLEIFSTFILTHHLVKELLAPVVPGESASTSRPE
jgi:hypothetical protein